MIKIKLKELLVELNKNASEMAKETSINRNTINALVNEKVDGVKFSTLEKICTTYGLCLSDLLELQFDPDEKVSNISILYKQEAEMVPFTIWPGVVALSQMNISNKYTTQSLGQMDGYFHKNYMVAFWDKLAMDKFAKIFYETYKNPVLINQYYDDYQSVALEIENLYNNVYGLTPADSTFDYFKNTFEIIKRVYTSFWLKSFFMEAFDAGFDQAEVKQIGEKFGFDKSEIEILTKSEKLSYDNERKLALLTIINKWVGRKESILKLINNNRDEIEVYKRQFDFYRSNYAEVFHMSDSVIKEEAEKYLSNIESLREELKYLSNYQLNQKKNILQVLKKHHLRHNPLYFFSKLTFFRENRKMVNLKGFHVLDFVLTYIESQTSISKKYLKFLTFDEVENALRGLVTQESLKKRRDGGILVSINSDDKNSIKIYEGSEAFSIKEELDALHNNHTEENQLITGFTASQGFAKGIAKIILSQADFSKFNQGDVLVTSMTKSDFMSLIEKASAIVTNENGLSTHATMISRELNIPCIIGTKTATTQIKDGDLVEVRAKHGTVRILKKE